MRVMYDGNDSIDKSLNFNNKNWLLFNKISEIETKRI
jgi:hypothetical protein